MAGGCGRLKRSIQVVKSNFPIVNLIDFINIIEEYFNRFKLAGLL